MSWAGLLLVDFLVGVGGVEPPGPLLLLALGERVLPQRRVHAVVVKLVEGGGGGGHLHLPPCPRALQQHWEAVGVACAVALKHHSRKQTKTSFRLEDQGGESYGDCNITSDCRDN